MGSGTTLRGVPGELRTRAATEDESGHRAFNREARLGDVAEGFDADTFGPSLPRLDALGVRAPVGMDLLGARQETPFQLSNCISGRLELAALLDPLHYRTRLR